MKLNNATELKNWNMTSTVRARKWAYDISESDVESDTLLPWFPEHMAPAFEKPEIKVLSWEAQQRLLARHLVYFLRYTTALELQIVNRAVSDIISNTSGILLPRFAGRMALQFYTDEAYHALFSEELANQVERLHTSEKKLLDFKRLQILFSLEQDESADKRPLFRFLTAFVSETGITKELFDLSSTSLKYPVACMFRDHLHDEKQHCKFFSNLFVYGWRHANEDTKADITRMLPSLMKTFALIDQEWLSAALESEGIDQTSAHEIAESLNSADRVSLRARRACTATFSALRSAGTVKHEDHRTPFQKAGLLDGQ